MSETIKGEMRYGAGTHGIVGLLFAIALVGMLGTPALADDSINLVLETPTPTATVGDTVEVQLWFVSDGDDAREWILADILLEWDSAFDWLGYEDDPGVGLNYSTTFQATPADPNQLWWSGATGFTPARAEPGSGTLVTTFMFEALAATPAPVEISILPGDVPGDTIVGDGISNLLGELDTISIMIVPEPGTAGLIFLGGMLGMRRRRR